MLVEAVALVWALVVLLLKESVDMVAAETVMAAQVVLQHKEQMVPVVALVA
jgi:hypothetical protein